MFFLRLTTFFLAETPGIKSNDMPNRSDILFISKENYGENPFECYLDNVPEFNP